MAAAVADIWFFHAVGFKNASLNAAGCLLALALSLLAYVVASGLGAKSEAEQSSAHEGKRHRR